MFQIITIIIRKRTHFAGVDVVACIGNLGVVVVQDCRVHAGGLYDGVAGVVGLDDIGGVAVSTGGTQAESLVDREVAALGIDGGDVVHIQLVTAESQRSVLFSLSSG